MVPRNPMCFSRFSMLGGARPTPGGPCGGLEFVDRKSQRGSSRRVPVAVRCSCRRKWPGSFHSAWMKLQPAFMMAYHKKAAPEFPNHKFCWGLRGRPSHHTPVLCQCWKQLHAQAKTGETSTMIQPKSLNSQAVLVIGLASQDYQNFRSLLGSEADAQQLLRPGEAGIPWQWHTAVLESLFVGWNNIIKSGSLIWHIPTNTWFFCYAFDSCVLDPENCVKQVFEPVPWLLQEGDRPATTSTDSHELPIVVELRLTIDVDMTIDRIRQRQSANISSFVFNWDLHLL